MRIASIVLLLAACGDDSGPNLVVDLRTDYRPGVEFTAIDTVLDVGDRERPSDTSASEGDDFVAGRRIAEYDGLPAGAAEVIVVLRNARGEAVADRTTRLEIAGETGLTVVITRRCRGVTCPGVGDPATDTECLAGVCVGPECQVGRLAACGSAACTGDSDCAVGAACAQGRCTAGACLEVARDDRCAPGERCDPDLGCTPVGAVAGHVDGGGADAGVLDAGTGDGGPPADGATADGGPADAGDDDGDAFVPECFDDSDCAGECNVCQSGRCALLDRMPCPTTPAGFCYGGVCCAGASRCWDGSACVDGTLDTRCGDRGVLCDDCASRGHECCPDLCMPSSFCP